MPSSDDTPYTRLPAPPDHVRGGTVLVRLVDGLAFRYRWATEGLDESDVSFQPGPDSMDLGQLLIHIHKLVRWVDRTVRRLPRFDGPQGELPTNGDPGHDQPAVALTLRETRRGTLETLTRLRELFAQVPDDELLGLAITGTPSRGAQPFWSMINGPLCDALTHVGQISSWRRLAGKPTPRADVFRGNPPDGWE